MKNLIELTIKTAITQLQQQGQLPVELAAPIQIERTRNKAHGDFACNIALPLAKALQRKPRDIAEQIVAQLPSNPLIKAVAIAGPGFINFTLAANAWQAIVKDILAAGNNYGKMSIGAGKKIHLEFVSSNPTGPLHVGHGRGAAYGAAVGNLLETAGFQVHREYYVNDGGRQMDILAASVWLRYLQSCGETLTFPSNGYQGDYVTAIAAQLKKDHGDIFHRASADVFRDVPADEPAGGDKEIHIDAIIERAKILLGAEQYLVVFDAALETILADIHADLAEFGVQFDEWFSERSLIKNDAVDKTIKKLKAGGHLYERDGALWFKSTDFGDDKDRVMLRENGQPTYFAVDLAYRQYNLEQRRFDLLLNVLGADHHGYVTRIRAGIEALGFNPAPLTVLIVQFATLYRGTERVQMSTRSGSFVTLRELREEVGTEAARFFYVMRKCEQHMDFDLELAKSQSNENPMYYLQYAHARICSVMRQLAEKNLIWDSNAGIQAAAILTEPHELDLLVELSRYLEVLEMAAINYEPHLLAHYLRDVANAFHAYYNSVPFIVDDAVVRNARLALIIATRQVLANGLNLLGVSAPESM